MLPFEQNPGSYEVAKILVAPSVTGDLSIAHNPQTEMYVITFSNYYCTNVSCVTREDVRAAQINTETLTLESAHFGITQGIYRIQWQAQVLYQPRTDEFLVIWSDNQHDGEHDRERTFTAGSSYRSYSPYAYPRV